MESHATSYDAVVVGARCAGATTAMLLARQGLDVLVVDRAELPADTLSTHAISRGGIVQLQRFGLLDAIVASGAPPIRSLSFHTGTSEPVVRTVQHRAGVDHLLAPRRYIMDAILLDAARRAGVTVETSVTVTGVVRNDDGTVGGVHLRAADGRPSTVDARLVVGADGVRSRTARAVRAPMLVQRAPSGAGHYLYARGLDADGFEFHLGDGGLAGVFPTHDDAAVVWACVPEARALRFDHRRPEDFFSLLDTFAPTLGERARAATVTEGLRSAVRMPNHVRSASGPGWALVGDAGYHRDPITGHGITDAFRDAELLAFHLGAALRGEIDEAVARARFGRERMCALLPIFDATTRIAAFPPVAEFVREQHTLSERFDEEATWLADRPRLPVTTGAVAAGAVPAVAA